MEVPGRLIKELLVARGLKPSDVERKSRLIAEQRRNSRFYISHATLAAIEAGSIPGIYKIFSLASCCNVSYEQLLSVFGIETQKTEIAPPSTTAVTTSSDAPVLAKPNFRFSVNFDFRMPPVETCLLPRELDDWGSLPRKLVGSLEPKRFLYALVGLQDNRLGDIIPPGSLVEVDTEQTQVIHTGWHTIRERPVYIVWHDRGYSCGWCQLTGSELLLIPDPLSKQPILRFRAPAEATVVGRIVHVWCALSSPLPVRLAASP